MAMKYRPLLVALTILWLCLTVFYYACHETDITSTRTHTSTVQHVHVGVLPTGDDDDDDNDDDNDDSYYRP